MSFYRKFALVSVLVGALAAVGVGPAAAGGETPPPTTGKIIVDKVTIPVGHPEEFSFTVTGQPPFKLKDASEPKVLTLPPGSYDVTEGTLPAWYWALDSIVCTVTKPNGGTASNHRPRRAEGVDHARCRRGDPLRLQQPEARARDRQEAHRPDEHGFVPVHAHGPNAVNLAFGVKGGEMYTSPLLKPGSGYSVTESLANLPDWENYFGECKKGSTILDPASFTIGERDEITCTFKNRKKPVVAPRLTVIKKVVNDNGGTAAPGDFTMLVEGTNVSDGSFPGAAEPGTTVTLDPGEYDVKESGPTGYDATFSGDCNSTIASGEHKTCTITNDDKSGGGGGTGGGGGGGGGGVPAVPAG